MSAQRRRPSATRSLWRAIRRARRPGSPSAGALARALPRLVAASASGRYTGLRRSRLALMTAAAAYIVSPVDLLPEGVLGPLGLVDDAAVLSWLAGTVLAETEAFLTWEAGEASRPGGAGRGPGAPGGGAQRPGATGASPGSAGAGRGPGAGEGGPDVVPGEVIG